MSKYDNLTLGELLWMQAGLSLLRESVRYHSADQIVNLYNSGLCDAILESMSECVPAGYKHRRLKCDIKYDVFYLALPSWEHWSGCRGYPIAIPDEQKTAELASLRGWSEEQIERGLDADDWAACAFDSMCVDNPEDRVCMWDVNHWYGALRIALLDHLLKWVDAAVVDLTATAVEHNEVEAYVINQLCKGEIA